MTNVLGIFGFLSFSWVDLLDIFMVGLLIFLLVRSIRGDSTVFMCWWCSCCCRPWCRPWACG